MFRWLIILSALTLAACGGDGMYDNTPAEAIRLSRTAVVVGVDGGVVNVGVVAKSGTWDATENTEWLNVSKEELTAIIFVEEYVADEDSKARTAEITFESGGETKTLTVTQLPTEVDQGERHAEYEVNKAVHDGLLDPWYYDGETRTEPADYNQTYKAFWKNYLENLPRNTLDGNTWSTGKWRYTYSFIEKNPLGTAVADEPRLGYGMEFDLGRYDGRPVVGRILYVEEGSVAAGAGLKRGDWFWKVNDIELQNYEINEVKDSALVYKYQYNRMIDSLVHPVEGIAPRLGMLEYNMAAGRLEDRGRTVSLLPERRRVSPVLHSSTIELTDVVTGELTRTGYLVLTRFDERYETEIRAEFGKFENLTHFVLDLRYNRSGTVEMARMVGNLLVPEAARGKTFARYDFFDGANNRTAAFEPEPTSVGVDTIVVLTGPRTAGASELLVNALRGIEPTVKLLVVGDVSQGMSVGMVRRQYESASHEYDAWIAALRPFNANGEGEYGYGFVPNGGTVGEWSGDGARWSETWGWKPIQGQTQDPLLFRAMELITGVSRMPANSVIPSTRRERPGLPREFEYQTNMTMSDE